MKFKAFLNLLVSLSIVFYMAPLNAEISSKRTTDLIKAELQKQFAAKKIKSGMNIKDVLQVAEDLFSREERQGLDELFKKHKVNYEKPIHFEINDKGFIFSDDVRVIYRNGIGMIQVGDRHFKKGDQPIDKFIEKILSKRNSTSILDDLMPRAHAFVFAMGAILTGAVVTIIGGAALGGYMHGLVIRCKDKPSGVPEISFGSRSGGTKPVNFDQKLKCSDLKNQAPAIAEAMVKQLSKSKKMSERQKRNSKRNFERALKNVK